MSGFSPICVNSLTYIGTMVVFTAVFFINMPNLPFPIQGCLTKEGFSDQGLRYLILLLWNVHFMRRTIEVLFVHLYKRKMPLIESIGAPIYYWVLALFIAWSVSKETYTVTYLSLITIGSVVFIIGEIGNCLCHVQLRLFRTRNYQLTLVSPDTGHVLPHGWLFNCVSCPHYFFEITSWFGYFLITMTLPSGLLLLFTIMTLAIYGHKKHNAYRAEFDGSDDKPMYPMTRKALIPFLF